MDENKEGMWKLSESHVLVLLITEIFNDFLFVIGKLLTVPLSRQLGYFTGSFSKRSLNIDRYFRLWKVLFYHLKSHK